MHNGESLLHTSYGEELVLRTVDEEHGLRTCHAGDVWIVHPAAQTREAVGKAAVLRALVVETHLFVGGHHPTDGGTRFDAVGEGRQHPGTVGSHRTASAANPCGVDLGHGGDCFTSVADRG